jgi:hypothetical protein
MSYKVVSRLLKEKLDLKAIFAEQKQSKKIKLRTYFECLILET